MSIKLSQGECLEGLLLCSHTHLLSC
jgi:hypothetical protein